MPRLRNSALVSRFTVVQAEGRTVAAAQIGAEGEIAGLFDVITATDARGRGYASAAVSTLLGWAWEHSIRTLSLQVTDTNAAALRIYRKFGFETLYTYHYCGRPGALA